MVSINFSRLRLKNGHQKRHHCTATLCLGTRLFNRSNHTEGTITLITGQSATGSILGTISLLVDVDAVAQYE